MYIREIVGEFVTEDDNRSDKLQMTVSYGFRIYFSFKIQK